jgi:hypothetical protein
MKQTVFARILFLLLSLHESDFLDARGFFNDRFSYHFFSLLFSSPAFLFIHLFSSFYASTCGAVLWMKHDTRKNSYPTQRQACDCDLGK